MMGIGNAGETLGLLDSPKGSTTWTYDGDGDRPAAMVVASDPHEDRRLSAGLGLLWRAYRHAQDVGEEVWQFAVLVSTLEAVGLGASELRRLVSRGYLAHAVESTGAGAERRRFRAAPLAFNRRRCFVLTDAGAALIREEFGLGEDGSGAIAGTTPPRAPAAAADRPCWDGPHRVLRVGRTVVRRFGRVAPNQERILTAFEEQEWPRRIADPLPEGVELVAAERLHDAIKCLNRGVCPALLHFHGDGSGRGVAWALSVTAGPGDEF